MTRTSHLGLPLVMPAQAQKHVTVNEALVRLDALSQTRVLSTTRTTPPSSPAEGDAHIVPQGASGAWEDASPSIAVWSNGGWLLISPRTGWQAWSEETSERLTFDGATWHASVVAFSSGGAATKNIVIEFDHVVTPGGSNSTAVSIPAGTQVTGITGRVLSAISGAGVTGWRLGVAGSDNRYSSGMGLSAGSYAVGLSGSPVTYYTATPLVLTAEGGSFSAGRIRLAIHAVQLVPPR